MAERTGADELRETWDRRLVLLLIAQPAQGWESEFKDITRREIERLAAPPTEVGRDQDD